MKSFRYCPTIGMLVAMLGCPNGAHPQTPAPAATPNRIEVEWKAAPRESTSSEGSPVAQPVISASSTAPAAISPPLTLPSAAAPDPFVLSIPAISPDSAPARLSLPDREDPSAAGPFPDVEWTSAANPYVWASVEYLNWWPTGNRMPPLVTSAPIGSLGTLDNPQTRILNGNNSALTNAMNGLRTRFGFWLDPCSPWGIEGGLFGFATNRQSFGAASNGDPGLFRPFFNSTIGGQDAELVALQTPNANGGFDPILSGSITVNHSTEFAGWETNVRRRLCSDDCWRLDLLAGYRYLRLGDTTTIQENLLATDPREQFAPLNTRILVLDQFKTLNTFNGPQIGLFAERSWGAWFANVRSTVALGDTHQQLTINGSTTVITPQGTSSTSPGGLLALPSNIGTYGADRFTVVPEIGLNVGRQITSNLRIFAGYSCIYWSNVARTGNQIDTVLNPALLPNSGVPVTGAIRPAAAIHDTGYFAQGFNAGIEFRW